MTLCGHLSKRVHYRGNLFQLHILFTQRVECKFRFVFDPVDGVIDQLEFARAKNAAGVNPIKQIWPKLMNRAAIDHDVQQ